MRKNVGIIKRVSCISLVFLLSINSFAAIVSDNDGAAFITKAEFDALKNDFQAQIDSYNTSIDNKIDGAIASYLAGIQLAKQVELQNLYAKIVNEASFTGSGSTKQYKKIEWTRKDSTSSSAAWGLKSQNIEYEFLSMVSEGCVNGLGFGGIVFGKAKWNKVKAATGVSFGDIFEYGEKGNADHIVSFKRRRPIAVGAIGVAVQVNNGSATTWDGNRNMYNMTNVHTPTRDEAYCLWYGPNGGSYHERGFVMSANYSLLYSNDSTTNGMPVFADSTYAYVDDMLNWWDTTQATYQQVIYYGYNMTRYWASAFNSSNTAYKSSSVLVDPVAHDLYETFEYKGKQIDNIKYNQIKNATGIDLPTRYGIAVAETNDVGTITLNYKVNNDSYVIFFLADRSGDLKWGGARPSGVGDTTYRVAANKKTGGTQYTLTIEKKDKLKNVLYVAVCPTTDGGSSTLDINDIKIRLE